MLQLLNPSQIELQQKISHLTQSVINPLLQKKEWVNAWRMAGDIGLLGGCIAEGEGGKGLSFIDTMVMLEAFSESCSHGGFTFSVIACWSASVYPMSVFPVGFPSEKWLIPLVQGKRICCNAMTEPGGGSDVSAVKSVAVKQGLSYTVNASKSYITNTHLADAAIVYVMTNPDKGVYGGMSALLLDINEFAITKQYQLSGFEDFPLGSFEVTNRKVSMDRLLGFEGSGFVAFCMSMNMERMAMSAMHLGVFQRMLNQTKQYVADNALRKKPQAMEKINHTIAQLEEEYHLLRTTFYRECAVYDIETSAISAEAAEMKVQTSNFVKDGLQHLQVLYGAPGYIRGNEIEQRVRDLLCSGVYSGSNEVLLSLMKRD
jgi:alkylation response protein AidB-like acyl-CoA dehydrogenase